MTTTPAQIAAIQSEAASTAALANTLVAGKVTAAQQSALENLACSVYTSTYDLVPDPPPAVVPSVTGVSPNSGAAGITVTITGKGFTGATFVAFGYGTSALTKFTVISDTQITATVPAGLTAKVDVMVTNAAGTSALSSADWFTPSNTPPPPTGKAGFGQPLMAPPAGYTASSMFFQDTFQTGQLNPAYWRNTMGSVNDWGNEPGYCTGAVSVAPASAGGGLTCDNSVSGASSCVVTCEPSGVGSKLLVTFPEAGWYIQTRMKLSDMTNGFFPAIWFPPEGPGAENDIFEGGWLGNNVNMNAHEDYAATGGAGNQQQKVSNIGVDLTKNFVIYGCEFIAGKSCKYYLNGQLVFTANPPCPGTTTYNFAITPQRTPGGSGGWHSQGPGTGQMFVAEVQAYALP